MSNGIPQKCAATVCLELGRDKTKQQVAQLILLETCVLQHHGKKTIWIQMTVYTAQVWFQSTIYTDDVG